MASLQPLVGEFNLPRLERVIFGPGKVKALGGELDRRGLKRVLVVTGQTLGSSKLIEKVVEALGTRCSGVFSRKTACAPATTAELVEQIERCDADCLVSFGGGSPIDTAKVAAQLSLETGRELKHIAVPTTLSASEYTAAAGVTDESTRVKRGVRDARLLPKCVINDPELTLSTPDWLWTATGMRALDHAVEAIYSLDHQPIADTLASQSISLLVEHLAASIRTSGVEQLSHRGHCQMAAWFSIFGAGNVRFGISHALGHQIGPKWNVPHGVTSCITLPHVMHFMAELAPERFGPIAAGLQVPFDPQRPSAAAHECSDRVRQFIAGFELPTTLAAAGVPHNELDQIVEPVFKELAHSPAVDRAVTREEILVLLHACY